MAFNAGDRVRVTDQSNPYRKMLGTVLSAAAGANTVRPDGYGSAKGVRLLDAQLMATSLESPITYPS